MSAPDVKSLIWVGSSLKALRAFPEAVKDEMGYALFEAQCGRPRSCTKLGSENRRCRKTMKKVNYVRSSGNVFADLELPDAEERLLKAQLAVQIRRFIEQKDWTQAETAEI